MSKKSMPIVIAVLLIAAAAAVYFFVLRDKEAAVKEPELPYNYAIEDSFVTNVKGSSKLFKATIVLVLDREEIKELMDSNEYVVRDTILFILRDLTEEDIRSSDIQDKLRTSIPEAINNALGIHNVVSVYFSDFVMQ